jgi:hypothetical protein
MHVGSYPERNSQRWNVASSHMGSCFLFLDICRGSFSRARNSEILDLRLSSKSLSVLNFAFKRFWGFWFPSGLRGLAKGMIRTANPPQGSKPQTTSAHLRSGKFTVDKNPSAKEPTRPATARIAKTDAPEPGPARKKRPASAINADAKNGSVARNAEHGALGGMLVSGVSMSQQQSSGGHPSEARIGNELMKLLEERAAARGISGAGVNVARHRESAASNEQQQQQQQQQQQHLRPPTAGSFRFEESGPSQTLREAVRKYAQIQTLRSIYSSVPTKPAAARPKTATGAVAGGGGALTAKSLVRKERPTSAVSAEQKRSKGAIAETTPPSRRHEHDDDAVKVSTVKRTSVITDLAHAQAQNHEKSIGGKQYANIVGGKRATIAELIARCV